MRLYRVNVLSILSSSNITTYEFMGESYDVICGLPEFGGWDSIISSNLENYGYFILNSKYYIDIDFDLIEDNDEVRKYISYIKADIRNKKLNKLL